MKNGIQIRKTVQVEEPCSFPLFSTFRNQLNTALDSESERERKSMATLDSDVPMVPAGDPSSSAGPSSKKPKRFEIKKWNAVALWAWGGLRHFLFHHHKP